MWLLNNDMRRFRKVPGFVVTFREREAEYIQIVTPGDKQELVKIEGKSYGETLDHFAKYCNCVTTFRLLKAKKPAS